MRVVFDSNIFISAFVIPGSQAEKAVFRIINNHDSLILSKTIIDEVLSVLAHKFSRDREAISRIAVYLAGLGEIVHTIRSITVLRDVPDNRILECAVSGKADVIVTGDKQMLALKEYKGIKIITLKEYLG
ncbi:MAG: putative toxin-antitoxin system toxin component, PIN family [Nitrospirae bacterium]|nr:putative toxin-antitoxin system toxin component, PIN family [Nitrospirota bacterium]